MIGNDEPKKCCDNGPPLCNGVVARMNDDWRSDSNILAAQIQEEPALLMGNDAGDGIGNAGNYPDVPGTLQRNCFVCLRVSVETVAGGVNATDPVISARDGRHLLLFAKRFS